jgi:hypothetical protein
MRELVPGLFHWTTQHPNLGQRVSSHYLSGPAAVLDPMVPEEGLGVFEGMGRPAHVVLSCRHHDRNHAEFVEAFGADFHVSEHGLHEYEGEDVEAYAIGDEIVPGITALANGPIAPDDTVLALDVEGGALLFADSLLSHDGELGMMPDSLLGDGPDQVRRDIVDALAGLLDQPFQHLLFAHGEPIMGEGHAALERFVHEQQSAR